MTEKPHPINPWLAKKVAAFRKACPDEQALRVRYRDVLKEYPDTEWRSFILEEALQFALREDPLLALKVEDTPLSDEVIARLNIQEAERLIDVLQITEEEFRRCIGITEENIKEIEEYLGEIGHHLEPGGEEETYKVSLRRDEAEREKRHEGYVSRLAKAEQMKSECGDVSSRIRQTVKMYQIAHEYCEENHIDVQNHAALLWMYCKFVMEKRTICPDILEGFQDYVNEMVAHFETTYGTDDPVVGDAYRKAGMMLMELGEREEALQNFSIAAEIFEELEDYKELMDCLSLKAKAMED